MPTAKFDVKRIASMSVKRMEEKALTCLWVSFVHILSSFINPLKGFPIITLLIPLNFSTMKQTNLPIYRLSMY